MTIRPFRVLVHRYIGLATIAFSVNAGLSGSLPAFYGEISVSAMGNAQAGKLDEPDSDQLIPS
jgi:uncharacterized iron-regulated membrane protein